MQKRNVYLVQVAVDFGHQNASWLPYSVGCIWSYANQFDDIKNNFILQDIFFKRQSHQEILETIVDPCVVAFSCYVWNSQYSLTLAEKIKAKWPDCIIVMGGPNAHAGWTKYKFIDTIVLAEGETTFTKILLTLVSKQLPELFYKERLTDLDVPSPYTTGVFDKIINQNPDLSWYMIIESTRGCPYQCVFCDWGGGTYSKTRKFNTDKIDLEIEWAVNHKVVVLLVPDANFGIFKERDLDIAKKLRRAAEDPKSIIQQIQFTYAKNTNDICFEIEKLLGDYSLGLTISVQTMDPTALATVKRSIMKMNDLEYVFSLAKKHNVRTYTELILGLPGETKDSFKTGITKLLELGQHTQIYVWLATVLPNSEMGDPVYMQQHGIKTKSVKVYQDNDSSEITEFVVGTDTMLFDDLIESYMYAWVVQNFHHAGFSEILAKYCRNVRNISYRQFYDNLYDYLQTDTLVGPTMSTFKQSVVTYLTQGEKPGDSETRFLITLDCDFPNYYTFKDKFVQCAINATSMLTKVPLDVVKLQRVYNFDKAYTYPIEEKMSFNIVDWVEEPVTYTINKIEPPKGSNQDFYDLALQKHLYKHTIEIK
jgi:putative methyltransferase